MTLEWSVYCVECGMLGEHLTAAKANGLAEKHTRTEKHGTQQIGTPAK